MINNKVIVDTCRFTYCAVVREISGNKYRVVVGEIKPDGKAWENCLAFYRMSLSTKEPIYKLMEAGLIMYPAEWCKQTFSRPYLPFNVVTGERVRNRIYQECIKENPCRETSPEIEADRIMVILKMMDKENAIALVEAGVMVGNGTGAQKIVLARLLGKKKRVKAYTPDRLSAARKGDSPKHTGTSGAEPSLPF